MTDLASVVLRDAKGPARTVDDLTTLFDLCLVVLDARRPAALEALRPVLERIDGVLSGSDAVVGALVVGAADAREATEALGPAVAAHVRVFVDPDGTAARALGVGGTPALVWVAPAPEVAGLAEGWDPPAWRRVLVDLAAKLRWTRPLVPAPGDPWPFPAEPL